MKSNFAPIIEYDLLPKSYSSEPTQALLYDGSTALVPTLLKKKLTFGGAANKLGGKDQPFKIPIDRIISFNTHCCTDAVKKRVRFKCCPIDACTSEEFASIYLQFISSPAFPIPLNYGLDGDTVFFPLVTDCGAIDCCRLIKGLTKYINNQVNYPVIAIASMIGTTWYLDIEAKFAGQDFVVRGTENLIAAEMTPNFGESLKARQMATWFDSPLVTECDPDKCMEMVEIIYKEFIPHYESGSGGFSNGSIPETVNLPTDNIIPIVFDPANPQSMLAKAALFKILTADGVAATVKPYLEIEGNSVCKNGPVFTYCITRADAGDEAALAALKADYPTFIQAGRTNYELSPIGTSSYSVSFLNAPTAPAPADADVIVVGSCIGACLTDDCPPLTSGGCSSC